MLDYTIDMNTLWRHFLSLKNVVLALKQAWQSRVAPKQTGPVVLSFLVVIIVLGANLFPRNQFFINISLARSYDPEADSAVIIEEAKAIESEPVPQILASQISEPNVLNLQEEVLGGVALDDREVDLLVVQESALVQDESVDGPFILSPEGRREIYEYTVQENDTISEIAEKFQISLATVLWANNLTDKSTIRVGQNLIILPVTGVRHKVVKNDTLASIAKKYKTDLGKIVEFNNSTMDTPLQVGQFVIVPDGRIPATPKPITPKTKLYAGKLQQLGDYFIFPTTGRITQGLHYNNAVDIANPSMPPVYAAAVGTIITADATGWNGGYGKYIKIQHPNGVTTVYGHFNKIYVSVGEHVEQGQVIGQMGSTGHSTGIHLHWEVHGAVNPLARYR